MRLAIIDDHAVFAEGLRILLNSAAYPIEVVVVETRPGYAVDAVARHDPDLAIVDLAMPPPGGFQVIAGIRARKASVRILALSGADEPAEAEAALQAGAHGFLSKTVRLEDLVHPLQAIATGMVVMPDPLLSYLLERSRRRPSVTLLESLSPDERRLWKLIARGRDTEEIAKEIFMSERTVKRQVASLLKRIGVDNRIEAAARAGQIGLLEEE